MAKTYDDGDRLRAARELMGLRSCRALVHHLAVDDGAEVTKYSYGKLSKIEAGEDRLSPSDAVYIATRLGLPRSFFTAPTVRLGDVAAGDDAEASPVELRILEKAPRSPRKTRVNPAALEDAPEGDEQHDHFERVLDGRAAGTPQRPPAKGPASSPQTGTRRR